MTGPNSPVTVSLDTTFTATVTGPAAAGTPTGNVTFTEGTTTLGTVPLDATGMATFSTSTLPVGPHTITATYGGNTDLAPSSGTFAVTIAQATSTTTVTAAPSPATFGQAVTFTATVAALPPAAGPPTGTVTFKDGTTTLGTGTVDANGVATFTTSTLPAGRTRSRPITAGTRT